MIYQTTIDLVIQPDNERDPYLHYYDEGNTNRSYHIHPSKVEWSQSVDKPLEMKIYLPKKNMTITSTGNLVYKYKNQSNPKTTAWIYRFDRVENIQLFLNGILKQIVSPGYGLEIQRFEFDGEFLVIFASDDTVQLNRLPKIQHSYTSGTTNTYRTLIQDIIPNPKSRFNKKPCLFWTRYCQMPGSNTFMSDNVWDSNIGNLLIPVPESPAQILQDLKSKYWKNLYWYIRSGTFFCGWKYWDGALSSIVNKYMKNFISTYEFYWPYQQGPKGNNRNHFIIKNDLKYNLRDKQMIQMTGSFQDDNKKSHTVYYGWDQTIKNKDGTQGAARSGTTEIIKNPEENITVNVKDGITLKDGITMLKDMWEKLENKGFTGGFTTFGFPTCNFGDIVNLYINAGYSFKMVNQGKENKIVFQQNYISGYICKLDHNSFRREITIDSTSTLKPLAS